ncbi:hypothetical protein GCM10011351_12310 [Paraliobacillus quinghaiensis]|uniref:Uncharacterized protein n=1 Tax=Paraliobacillus quinghaiensis TaxID=470815 RepID=A0A917WTT0_9BACI|nr:hypothetical protein [Paraliobacillus quinghaiensis]GGM27948.1 hypothetical protein GCM10011351_12310 [Paraliobacillus quinghaiensis]
MKVQKVIEQLEKTLDILRCYEHWKFEDMLDDIKEKVSNEKKIPLKEARKTSLDKKLDVPINEMEKMSRDELTVSLNKYKKAELVEIGNQLELKLAMSNNKPILIESIANHFSYLQLNEKMANRKRLD